MQQNTIENLLSSMLKLELLKLFSRSFCLDFHATCSIISHLNPKLDLSFDLFLEFQKTIEVTVKIEFFKGVLTKNFNNKIEFYKGI